MCTHMYKFIQLRVVVLIVVLVHIFHSYFF